MTDRLSTLLHEEAAHLHVPAAASTAVLARGRALRRRRRLSTAGAALAVLAALTGGTLAATSWPAHEAAREIVPAAPLAGGGAVFSIGTTVYYDGGQRSATIDDKAIKSLHYTSAGVLVRHGNNPYSDGGGPQRFSLVKPDGTVAPLSVRLEETVHATDPAQPYLAYAEVTRLGLVQVVVHDVARDREVARVPVTGEFVWGGWAAPPVALSGDIVYMGTEQGAWAVNWRTGEIGKAKALTPGYPDVEGGRSAQWTESEARVVDANTGETLLTVPTGKDGGYLDLAPGGRFARMAAGPSSFTVYTVDSGQTAVLDGPTYEYGWTANGDLFRVEGDRVTTCPAGSAECTTATITLDPPESGEFATEIKLGGIAYES